ncbi:MAG: tetratricopeptide repeat protein [Prevotellaceae bacterium]|nr:tetratricopeptide repeat protein [Prevotellaceae bacterium]
MKRYLLILLFSLCLLPLAKQASAQISKEYFFIRGTNELVERRYANAIGYFNVLIKADTGLHDAYFRRAIAKYNLGDMIGAQADFNKAISLNPVFTYAYFYRAVVLNSMGSHTDALKDLEIAVELRPEVPGLYYIRGISYFSLQQFNKAIDDFNKFLRYEPKASEGYINRGTSKLFLKDTLAALEDYNRAIQLNRFDPDGYSRRGRLYVMQNKQDLALKDFNEALKLDTTNSVNYYFRAIAEYEKNNVAAALKDLDKVLELDPYNALTLFNRAIMLSQIGSYDKALGDYTRALEINSGNVLIYYNRAAIYMQKQMYRNAIADYSKAIELYPDFANAYLNRSYAKQQSKDLRGAKIDQDVAQKKIAEHQSKLDKSGSSDLADTSYNFNKLVAFDADFGNKNFTNEMLQYQRVDIKLQPQFRLAVGIPDSKIDLSRKYFNANVEQLKQQSGSLQAGITAEAPKRTDEEHKLYLGKTERYIDSLGHSGIGYAAKASLLTEKNQYNNSLSFFKQAIAEEKNNPLYYFARSVAESEMVDFISSIESNSMQTIVLESDQTTSVQPKTKHEIRTTYSYDDAIEDLNATIALDPTFCYAYYNRGNLKCNSNQMPEAIDDYVKAIELYPNFAEAYYNRGLVQIFMQDTEKGCLDISKSGELGIKEAYNIIKRYCTPKR